jgi:hypothetical protein
MRFPCIPSPLVRIQLGWHAWGHHRSVPTLNTVPRGVLKRRHAVLCIALCSFTFAGSQVLAQVSSLPLGAPPESSDHLLFFPQSVSATQGSSTVPGDKNSTPDSPQLKVESDEAQQTKRILWVIPNYRSVTANTYLPPLSFKEKFWLATQDSFDYSAFIWVGMVAGIAMGTKSEPSFGQGAAGYGIYYAHNFADNTIENYLVEAIVPAATKEDPRYYTLGHGGFFKRSGYALSRLLITRTDSGNPTFNFSEIVGAGAAAGIGNFYYPNENEWVKTYQRWGSQILQDGISNIAKEFWPDINRAVFHNKY